jgi:hypothetical protein
MLSLLHSKKSSELLIKALIQAEFSFDGMT